jgi:hypothetical protein
MTRCATLSTVEATGVTATRAGANLGRHGGREEQALPLRRKLGDDAADRRQEAQIQHFVCLVEYQYLGAGER